MVDIEIRRPYFDEESQKIEWQLRGIVRATAGDIRISVADDDSPCVLTDPVLEASTGEMVSSAEQPERWARSLPDAYRSGDLVAVVIYDDEPLEVQTMGGTDEPVIPDPPQPEFAERQTEANEVTTIS